MGELVRLAREGDLLVPGQGRPGRGAWVCAASLPCLERALSAGGLSRALRHRPLEVAERGAIEQALGLGHGPGGGVGG